jgi:CheY-like chemotaxis protein
MATKVFILANKNSAAYLKTMAIKLWNISTSEDGRKSGKRNDIATKGDSKRHFDVELFENYDDYCKVDFTESIKIKSNKSDKVNYKTFNKIFVLITPELYWKSNNIDEGYEYALEILNHKLGKEKLTIQFRFLSVLPFNKILEYSSLDKKRLIEAFPYFDLISEQEKSTKDLFIEYSPTHYQLIKRLAVSDTGYLNTLIHDINGLIKSIMPTEKMDYTFFQRIAFLDYLDKSNNLITLAKSYTFDTRIEILSKIRDILLDLYIRVDSSINHQIVSKLSYRVLIVEDDPVYRDFLKGMLSNYFKVVDSIEPERNVDFIETLREWLPEKAEKYDIVLLDLLFKNENGNWAGESGLDLYKEIKNKNAFCVTPLVTSLPRAVVASLIKELEEAGIPYHLLLSKANGEEFLKLDFKDKLPDIIKTCRENEKRKRMYKPIPTEGIFKGISVTGTILKLMTEKKELFDEIVKTSQSLFQKFIDGELTINTTGWNKGELPSPQKKDTIDETFLEEKLPSILAHRLMVIYFALKNDKQYIDSIEYEKQVLNKKICKTGNLSSGYLNTKLGFNKFQYLITEEELDGFIIEFKHFFPHEWLLVSGKIKKDFNNEVLDKYRELRDWFHNILLELTTYESWDELYLEFNPYINTSKIDKTGIISISDISEGLTISNLINFLNALVTNFDNQFVAEIMEVAKKNFQIDDNKVHIPPKIKHFIDQIFEL